VVVFGPKKLPELGSSIGKALRSFKQEMNKAGEPEVKTDESSVAREPVAKTTEKEEETAPVPQPTAENKTEDPA
jgi:sec-independent protein translocase protein TatA